MKDPQEQFERLFAAHADAVHRFVVRRSPAASEDVVAETFLIAWRKLDQVPDDAAPWLFTTARWVLRNTERSERRRERLVERQRSERPSTATDPAERLTDQLLVREVLATLSAADQEILRLAAWDQVSAAAGGRILGCSAATFSVRLHRARRRFGVALDTPQHHAKEA